MYDYAWLVDSGGASGIADLFTDDGEWLGADGHGMRGDKTSPLAWVRTAETYWFSRE